MQKDTPENRVALSLPKSGEFDVVGNFPKFELWKDTCACDLMEDARGKIVGLVPAVEHFLGQPMVKSVDVLWYWLAEQPEAPPMEKLEFGEFSRKAETAELKQGTIFRVFKKWRANKRVDRHGSRGADAG